MELSAISVGSAMHEAICEVLETMAFMEVMESKDDFVPGADEPVFYTRLPIYKPSPAMAGLVIPQSLALELAGAMMMREFTMEEDEFDVMDVLSEVANTVAGSLLTHMLPDLDAFELGLPECRVVSDSNASKEWDNSQEFQFSVDGKNFLCTWEAS
jgi:chemotaxis protein CheY-P-specific phosphatase CheC